MEVILRQHIKGLGQKYDLLQVKAGYGRNYLIPKGYAELATPSLKKMCARKSKATQGTKLSENLQTQIKLLRLSLHLA